MGLNMRYLDLKRKIRDARMWAIQGITEAGSGTQVPHSLC